MADDDQDFGMASGTGYPGVPDQDTAFPKESAKEKSDPAPRAQPVDPAPAPRAQEVPLEDQERDVIQHELWWRNEEARRRQQSEEAHKYINEQMLRIKSTPLPEMPSEEQFNPIPEIMQQQQQGYPNAIKAGIMRLGSILLPLHRAFGARSAAAGSAMEAYGNAFSNRFGNSRSAAQTAKMGFDLAIRNGDKLMDYYQKTIQNRKMTIDQKTDQLNLIAEHYKDYQMYAGSMADDFHKKLEVLQNREKLLNDAKKMRAEEEGKIHEFLGAGKDRKDYIARLADMYPDIRDEMIKAISGAPGAHFSEAYSKGIERYPYEKFHKEQEDEKLNEIKAGAESRAAGTQLGKQEAGPDPLIDPEAREKIFGGSEEHSSREEPPTD